MTGQHVGEESDHQGERLGEYTDKLYQRYERHRHFEPCRNLRPEDILPVSPSSEKVDYDKGSKGQDKSHGDIAGHIDSSREERYETHEVVDQDKEKHRQEEGREPAPVFSNSRLYQVLLHCLHSPFHQGRQPARSLGNLTSAVPACGTQHQGQHYRAVEQECGRSPGQGQVKGPDHAAVGKSLHYFPLVFSFRSYAESKIRGSFVEFSGRETMPSGSRTVQYHREVQTDLLLSECPDMPPVTVLKMAQYQLLGAETLFLTGISATGGRHRQH